MAEALAEEFWLEEGDRRHGRKRQPLGRVCECAVVDELAPTSSRPPARFPFRLLVIFLPRINGIGSDGFIVSGESWARGQLQTLLVGVC